MSNQFKPGDLAIIIHAEVVTQNIGMCCELLQLLAPGEECLAPDGDVVFWPPEQTRSVWLVAGDSIVGRKGRGDIRVETPGHCLVLPEWLIPLRGDFQPEQQKSKEVAHG
jgi:hypothetical protein